MAPVSSRARNFSSFFMFFPPLKCLVHFDIYQEQDGERPSLNTVQRFLLLPFTSISTASTMMAPLTIFCQWGRHAHDVQTVGNDRDQQTANHHAPRLAHAAGHRDAAHHAGRDGIHLIALSRCGLGNGNTGGH